MHSKKQIKIEHFGEIGAEMVEEHNEDNLKHSMFHELENFGINGVEDGDDIVKEPCMSFRTSVDKKTKKLKCKRDTTASQNYVCPECKFPFSTRESLKMHLISILKVGPR